MTSASLRLEQIRALLAALEPQKAYLAKLGDRLEQRRFPRHDELKRATDRAEKAMNELVSVRQQMERLRRHNLEQPY